MPRQRDNRSGGFLFGPARRIMRRLVCFIALFLIAYLGFLFLNALTEWITNRDALNTLYFIRDVAILSVVGLSGLEFILGRRRGKLWLFIIYAAILTAAVILMLLFHADVRLIGDTANGSVGIVPL